MVILRITFVEGICKDYLQKDKFQPRIGRVVPERE
jgi:hypothetical protein